MGLRFHWRPFLSEMIGTSLLVLGGLSLMLFGTGGPMARLIPSEELRRLITGLRFGTTGAAIALFKAAELILPPLYAFMVWAESPISGTRINTARSLGAEVRSGRWEGWWIYWVGPVAGAFGAVLACSLLAKFIEVAKLRHFNGTATTCFVEWPRQVRREEGMR